MGKKKGGRRGRDSDGEDASSSCTQSTFATNLTSDWDDEAVTSNDSPFDRHIDALYEKRGSTREAALQGLCSLLAGSFCYDDCMLRQNTLSSLFLGSIRRGSGAEATLAMRCLGLYLITLGPGKEAESVLPDAEPVLKQAAMHGKSPAVRAAAVDAIAASVFVAEEDPAGMARAMATLRGGFRSASPAVAAAALRGWALLLSALPRWKVDPDFCEQHLPLLAACLHAQDVEVRNTAGQAAALLYHASGLYALAAGAADDDDDSAGEGGDEEERAAALRALAPDMDDVVSRMRALATHRGDAMRRNKRERASLRGTFRALCGTVADGQVGVTKVKLQHGDVLVVDSLAGNVQLAALRRVLADGFQTHMQENPTLHAIFGFEPSTAPPERLSGWEKRMYRSPASAQSKARTQSRSKARAATAQYKGAMLGDGFG